MYMYPTPAQKYPCVHRVMTLFIFNLFLYIYCIKYTYRKVNIIFIFNLFLLMYSRRFNTAAGTFKRLGGQTEGKLFIVAI